MIILRTIISIHIIKSFLIKKPMKLSQIIDSKLQFLIKALNWPLKFNTLFSKTKRKHKGNHDPNWLVQFNICLWVVHGLFDFHEIAQPWIIHQDIKANNIVQPKIVNFGLVFLFPKYQTHIITMHIVGKMQVISTY
jgi:hypothetical protein